MYAYIHPNCAKPAFLVTEKPVPGRAFLSVRLHALDNTPLPHGSGHTCQSCGEAMFGAGQVEQVVNYLEWKHWQDTESECFVMPGKTPNKDEVKT